MLLEDDVAWKEAMTQKIQRLEESMDRVFARIDVAESQHQGQAHSVPMSSPPVPAATVNDAPTASSTSSQQPPRWQVVMDSQGGPASIPASCVSEIRTTASSGNMPASQYPDLITLGVLSLGQALSLFDIYHLRLDHFLYKILGDLTSLDAIRKRSALLTAAVCTVGALHSQSLGQLYDVCYREYKSLATTITFSPTANVDDVRALCIGAFWLHELSWALIGTAVRIASDLKLHHGIYRALNGDREGYLQARLYYLVYVCDHHFSVAYGRPPMSRERLIVDSATRFLETEHTTEDDTRLVSQVKVWAITGQVFDTCGVDVDTPIPLQYLPKLRRYSIELDIWYADWNETFRPNRNVGNYPQKGVGMHWNFAKLYLCSHAFRGVSTAQEKSQPLPSELEEIANTGVLSAMSILNVIVSDHEMRSFLHGLPLYFDTMIAFAVVFLLRVATKYANTIRIDTDKILLLVSQIVAALNEITHYMHPQHLLVAIAEGLQKLLCKCQEQPHIMQEPMQQLPATLEHSPTEIAWMENITNFDFLTNVPNVDDWVFHYPVPNGAHPTHYSS
ncbi:Transcription factor [Penicillium occitanis (nom. inval.)]|nr:Transcription factor [Penicillium occitanis (nom. inval.)]PCH09861.1 hypothetical protein PENOC_007450 [Penicillium occitanis (nom. inval.)]